MTSRHRFVRTRGTRTGAPGPNGDQAHHPGDDVEDTYEWGVDLVGFLELGGLRPLLNNRAALRLAGPLRLT